MTALVQWLRTQKERRGVLAQLRCGIVSGKQQRAWPLLARFDGIEGHKGEVIRTIAALFSAHPEESTSGSMGSVCRKLCSADERSDDEKPGPIGIRFQHLLAAETAEVCPRVVRTSSPAGFAWWGFLFIVLTGMQGGGQSLSTPACKPASSSYAHKPVFFKGTT